MSVAAKNIMKYTLLLTFGGYLYVCLEILYRGRSDTSMMFCATVCAIPMVVLNNFFTYEFDFLAQIIISTLFATANEWITGLLINQDYHIWDYRNVPLHSTDGQVCVPFMVIWAVISAAVIIMMDAIDYYAFDYMPEQPPYYKIFGKVIFRFKKEGDD